MVTHKCNDVIREELEVTDITAFKNYYQEERLDY